jgi:hypothetical protein
MILIVKTIEDSYRALNKYYKQVSTYNKQVSLVLIMFYYRTQV